MTRQTFIQSIMTFLVNDRLKKMTYNGSITEANVIVKQHYPTATGKYGDTKTLDQSVPHGAYICIDVSNERVEHQHSPERTMA